jgi:hypothetical protein
MKRITIATVFLATLLIAAQAKADFDVRAYCPITSAEGFGHGATLDIATRAAIAMCYARGGGRNSCARNVSIVKKK